MGTSGRESAVFHCHLHSGRRSDTSFAFEVNQKKCPSVLKAWLFGFLWMGEWIWPLWNHASCTPLAKHRCSCTMHALLRWQSDGCL